jgi:hypothetical protein
VSASVIEIVGIGGSEQSPLAVTVKTSADVVVTPSTVTVICPVVALVGTNTTIDVDVEEPTDAVAPLNFTTLSEDEALKSIPVIVTSVPGDP